MPRVSATEQVTQYNPNEYVSNGGFGLDYNSLPYPSAIEETFIHLDTTDPVLVDIRLREAYDTKYGICDHTLDDPDDVFKLVKYYEKEDVSITTLEEHYTERYLRDRVKEHFGYTFSEFLALPIDKAEYILKKSQKCTIDAYQENQHLVGKLKEMTGEK